MAVPVMLTAFSAGELSPSLYGRVDLAKFHTGAALIRNGFVNYRGGVSSRAGLAFVGPCKQPGTAPPPRDIPFQFSITQGYALEFGDQYMRVKSNGAYVTETPLAISGATNANPCVLTVAGNTFVAGDWIFVVGVQGMTQLNGKFFIVANPSGSAFQITDTFGTSIDATGYGVFVAGGTAARIYTISTPYAAADLPSLKYAQSADVMSLTLNDPTTGVEYAPYELTRIGNTNWTLAPAVFTAAIAAPASIGGTTSQVIVGASSTNYSYVVTALALNGEESIASPIVNILNSIDIATQAGSLTINWAAVSGAIGYNIYKAPASVNSTQGVPVGSLFGFAGTAAGLIFVDSNITQDFTTVPPLHKNPFARGAIVAVTPGTTGSAYAQATTTAAVTSATGTNAVIVPVVGVDGGVDSYIVQNGGQNYLSTDPLTVSGSPGSGATASINIGPTTGTYPGVVSYFQQRRVYANTLNQPDTYFMSKPGSFLNFDSAIPAVADDAITGTPWSQQVNGIQAMVNMPNGLVVLTGLGAWQLSGGALGAAVTPENQVATPQAYNGCHQHLQAIIVNYDVLYVQSKGSIVRDLAYNFFVNIYTGTDMTVLSNHLFQDRQIVSWAWCEEPNKIIWAVLDNGTALSFTYLKEQDVYGWARHDTNGLFQGVVSVVEPPVDAPYFIVRRYIGGRWQYFAERMDNRDWQAAEDCFCADAALSYPMPTRNAGLAASAASGTGVSFTASSAVFSSADVGSVIRMGGGIATVTAVDMTNTIATATITQPITATIPNDPNNTPLPALSPAQLAVNQSTRGGWTITVPTSTVSGLDYLNGMTVAILADGGVVPNAVVSNGAVSLPRPATAITVGLPYTVQVESLYLDIPGEPTSQGRRKHIAAVTARVENSRGFTIGTNQPTPATQPDQALVTWSNLKEWKQRGQNIYAGTPLPLFTGDARVIVPGNWAKPGQLAIEQDYPLPLNLLALIPEVVVGDDPG